MRESEGCDESRVLTSREEKASKVDWKPRVDDLGLLSDSHVEVAVRSDKVRRPAPNTSKRPINTRPPNRRARKRRPSMQEKALPSLQASSLRASNKRLCRLSWQGPRIEGGSNTRGCARRVSLPALIFF